MKKKLLVLFLNFALTINLLPAQASIDYQNIGYHLTANIFNYFLEGEDKPQSEVESLEEINNLIDAETKMEKNSKILSFISPEKGAKNISRKSPVTFLFSESVFSLENPESVANRLKEQITIEPAIEGSWQILGTSGILFEPKNEWNNSTHYNILISSELTGEEITHNFQTPRITLQGVQSYDLINQKPVILTFSQKVDLAEVQKIKFKPSFDFDVEYNVYEDGSKTEKDIKIIPRANWKENTRFSLTIPKGFSSAEGPLKMETDLYRNFRTIDKFKIKKVNKPEDVFGSFTINFTTPVSSNDFVKYLEITPKPEAKIWEAYLEKIKKNEGERNYFRLPPIKKYWNPKETYEVRISKDLVDKYERSLDKDFSQKFSTKFPTTFRKVFIPENNSVLDPKTKFKPTFWYSGNITSINVVIKETLVQKEQFTKIFAVEPSLNKETFWELDLYENFPELFDKNGNLLPGKYEMKVEATKAKSIFTDFLGEKFGRDDYWWPQEHSTNFYVSDFAVSLKQFPEQKFEIKISAFPGNEALSDTFTYEIYKRKDYNENFFGEPVERKENIRNYTHIKPQNIWDFEVLVKSGDLIGFGSRNFQKGIAPHEANVSVNQRFYERDQKRFIGFSDRPLYKPGQKVYFKSIFRELETKGKTFPLRKVNLLLQENFTVEITDPRWNHLDPIKVTGTKGSVDGYWDIPEDAAHGNYRFSVRSEFGHYLGEFQIFVGEYRKSNFLLEGEFEKDVAFYKETEKITVKANFAFGGALKGRPVTYRVYLEGQDDCFWGFWRGGSCSVKEKKLVQGEGILDINGEFQKFVDLDFEMEKDDPVWNNLKFRVTVRDGDAEENSLEKSIRFYMSTEKIVLDRIPYYFEKNTVAHISGKITNWEDKIKSNKQIFLKLSKTKPQTYRILTDSDESAESKEDVVWEKEIISDEFGAFELNFTVPEKAGNYKLSFASIDEKGRKTETLKNFWVPGVDDKNIMIGDEKKILPLILDKDLYEVGDRVEIFMPHSEWEIVNARATLERGEILEELPVNQENQTVSFEIEKWMVPNVYVSVLLEGKDGNNNPKIKWGIIDIPVVDSSRKLNINITPDKEVYKPGETASFEISTLTDSGVVSAELTVVIVDETLLSIKSRQQSDLLKVFLAKLPLGISLSHTLANFISQDQIDLVIKQIEEMELIDPDDGADYSFSESEMMDSVVSAPMVESLGMARTKGMAQNMIMKEFKSDSEGITAGSAVSPGVAPRENFQDTAKFIGKIYTDREGKAKFDFQLPDNLTTWNIYIVGHTEENNFGSTEASVKTKLPLLISELVPNFFQMGDQIEVGLLIRRDIEEIPSETVEVTLQLPEGFVTPEMTKRIVIEDEGRVFFPLTITDNKYDLKKEFHKIKFGFSVKGESSGLTDSIVLERKLFPPKIELTAAEFLRVETSKILKIKPDLDRAITSKILVKVFLSLAEKLENLIDVTARRNYGCAEQRFSHSTSILVQKEFDKNLGRDSDPIDLSYLRINKDYIEKAFINGGGFAFWKHEDKASFWVTSQILEFAALWEQYGGGIDESKLSQSRDWLKRNLLQKCERNNYWNCISDSTRQNAGYVLAKSSALNSVSQNFQQSELATLKHAVAKNSEIQNNQIISSRDLNALSRYTHSLESKVWWLKTARILKASGVPLLESDEKRVESFWTEVESHLKARDRYVFWEENKDYWSFYSQNERLTSLIFEEILIQNKLPNYKHKIARYLSETKMKELSGNTALRLLQSLGQYAKNNEAQNLGAEYSVSTLDLDILKQGYLEDLDSEYEIEKDVTGDSSFTGLVFEPKNEKAFYADVVLQETFPAKLIAPVSRGFWMERAIYALDDEEMKNPLTNLNLGENYVVRLKVVTNTSHRQVMIQDKIPSGSEFVNFEFDNTNKELEKYSSNGNREISPYGGYERHCWGWCRPSFDHKEFHAEKARYFAHYLSPGTYEIKYIIKTRLPGKFEVLPARVEEMYYPEVFAITKGDSIIIERE